MPVVLITGAASGLGLGFLLHYARATSNTIIAIDRTSVELYKLSDTSFPARVITQVLDLTVEVDVLAFVNDLERIHGINVIDVVIHSAGVRGLVPDVESTDPASVAQAETLQIMDTATMLRTFQTNCVATFVLFRALVPLLRATALRPATVVTMSSRMGSVSYNSTGGAYAYRASKAALNAVIKSLSLDVKDVVWLAVHPGRVQTGLVKSLEPGAIRVEEAIAEVLNILEKAGLQDSGRFVDRWGHDIGW